MSFSIATTTKLLLALLLLHDVITVHSFTTVPRKSCRASMPTTTTTTTTTLAAGMGMATKPNGKKKGGKKDKKKSTSPPYDVSAALIKNEKLYEELMAESTKALMNDDDNLYGDIDLTTEYIIAARAKPDNGSSPSSTFVGASDWVPVAQLCIVRSISQDDNKDDDHESVMESTLTAAVSYFCREINYLGCLSAPSAFKSLPRNNVEYGIEPIESFMKHVYEDVIEGKNKNSGSSNGSSSSSSTSNGMSKAQAREILELDAGVTDAALIKTAYKKQSFKYHPDRISEEDRETLSERFYEIKQAYETLNSGVRSKDANGSQQSWYASLGGRDRNGFLGPISLLSMEKAGALCNKAFKSAVVGIDPDLTMAFVARNQSAARL
mmetsp:Transcript_10465/g.17290  ORF Transcript_10465/g.17290 Transcript_10465/m.17290 type:complete len:380 (-) Transcript_10465:76-1215(-)